jgi:hypothetical protein
LVSYMFTLHDNAENLTNAEGAPPWQIATVYGWLHMLGVEK